MRQFRTFVLDPIAMSDPAIPVASSRCGAVGFVDVQDASSLDQVLADIETITRHAKSNVGIRIGSTNEELVSRILSSLPPAFEDIIVTVASAPSPDLLSKLNRRVWLEATSSDEAQLHEAIGAFGVIAKGSEAGGWTGEETTFVLVQRLVRELDVPVLAMGGIGLHTAAACFAAGCAGIVLDSQVALTRESPLPDNVKGEIRTMDGSETVTLGNPALGFFRCFTRGRMAHEVEKLAARAEELGLHPSEKDARAWRDAVRAATTWGSLADSAWPLGQDAAFASSLAARHATVGGIVTAIRDSVRDHLKTAAKFRPLDARSPLAISHGTTYPIVQGAMTRVSDRAPFADAVADGGALPFLALALLRAPEVEVLLEETRQALGDRSWGVGILGFVPADLREEQLEVVRRHPPKFALIAGGRPDQARELEDLGIATYLHVPSPGLLRHFAEDGARRFVFEGRECGGHVGPRSSFVLWESMIETLLEIIPRDDASAFHVLFAGGVHDALSSAMVAALSAPLAKRGVNVGVLMGTAYLFTREAVASGAIVEQFQNVSRDCDKTVLLEMSPGHVIRCADNAFADEFEAEKARLRREGMSGDEVREHLESLNTGRLRIASKGIRRNDNASATDDSKFVAVDESEALAQGMFMVGQVAALRHDIISIAELHDDVARAGTEILVDAAAAIETDELETEEFSPLAIVGMSCVLPKATNIDEFWQNVLGKVSTITEIPADRGDWDDYFDADPSARDRTYSRWGGFLEKVTFDPMEFGMPPNSLRSIDPLHLLALKAAKDAIADAGYSKRPFDRSRTSVILGLSGGAGELGNRYSLRAHMPYLFGENAQKMIDAAGDALPEWNEDSLPGMLLNVTAGRIANRLDFGGLNFGVDAACSSSLAALHVAARELHSGSCDTVVIGGADNTNGPNGFLSFGKTQALSATGACHTFDARADGIAISEGVVMMVIKRLEDAERDGDRIYALIRGTGGSSDGKAKGLTAPRAEGQISALDRAYKSAHLSPATVELFEAHGTGTVVGDRTEIRALSSFLADAGAETASAAIGSVKSMLGHTKAAAGMAGLAKVALALHRKVLPATIGVTVPNPEAGFDTSAVYINSDTRPWIHSTASYPRRAGISAFGFGGTNFHVVAEEYTGNVESVAGGGDEWPVELFLWNGENRDTLIETMNLLAADIVAGATPRLRDLAMSVCERAVVTRAPGRFEVAIVAGSLEDLRSKLDDCAAILAGRGALRNGVFVSSGAVTEIPRTAFLFPGQGSQYPGMLSDLAIRFATVREAIERADTTLDGAFDSSLSRYVFPPPTFTPEAEMASKRALTDTRVAQPALGAVETGALHLLKELGVSPSMTAGHSYGEYVALHAAGVFDEDTLLKLSAARGRVIFESAGETPGTMAAVSAGRDIVTSLTASIDGVWIANVNAPAQTILAGTEEGLAEAAKIFKARGIEADRIPVACAFHSPLVADARDRLAEVLAAIRFSEPSIPVYSNTSASSYPRCATEMTDLLARHLVEPVRFLEEIDAMYAAGARVFVEVGPKSVLTSLTRSILGTRPHVAIALDAGGGGISSLLAALAQLAIAGVALDVRTLFKGRGCRRIDLSKLRSETIRKPLPATTWFMNGAKAWPAGDEAPVSGHGRLEAWAATSHATPPVASATLSSDDQVMVEFQRVMSKALDVQRSIMMAYLGEPLRDTVSTSGLPTTTAIPEQRPPVVPLPAVIANPVTPVVEVNRDVVGQLVSIVAERTGYPAELLSLDVDLEAELGIDSIKRTEILGAVRKAVLPASAQKVSMETLAKAKTLRGIADALEKLVTDHAEIPTNGHANGHTNGSVNGNGNGKAIAAMPVVTASPVEVVKPTVSGTPEVHAVPLSRTQLVAVEESLPSWVAAMPAGGVIVITDDESGVADTVAAAIVRARGRAKIIRHRYPDDAGAGSVNAVNLADHSDVERFVGNLRAMYGRIAGVIHLLPLRDSTVRPLDDRAPVKARINSEVKGLFHLLKEVRSDLVGRGSTETVSVIAATRMGGRWSLDAEKDSATVHGCFAPHGAIAGLLKTVAIEWPGTAVRAVDFDLAATPEQIGHRVFDELRSSRGDVQVGYTGKTRLAVRHATASVGSSNGQRGRGLSDGAVILASGGACGITAEIVIDVLRETRNAKVILLGRTPLPQPHEDPSTASLESAKDIKSVLLSRPRNGGRRPSLSDVETEYRQLLREREIRRNITRMSALASVQYEQADVQHEPTMRDIVTRARAEFGRLDCVLHAAGVIQDKLVAEKSSESFSAVFDTKVDGALSIAKAVSDAPPSLMIFFSSTAAAFGNRGQADYAAANATLDALASQLHSRWGTRVLSINWGPWFGAGMVTSGLERQLREAGTKTIGVHDGVAAAHSEIFFGERHRTNVMYTGGDGLERMPGEGDALTVAPAGDSSKVAEQQAVPFDSSDDNLAQAAAG